MQQEIIQGFRLSPQQKRLWLLQDSGQSSAYFVRCAVLIEGLLNIETFEKAIRNVIRQQEILRTSFSLLPGMTIPVQIISEDVALSLETHDFIRFSAEEQHARIGSLFAEAASRTVDFQRLPLFHNELAKLAPDRHVWILSAPSVLADQVSLNNLIGQAGQSYDSYLHNEEVAFEAMQYADFAEWQNELLENEDAASGRQFWKSQNLEQALAVRLAFENERIPGTSFRPTTLNLEFDAETLTRLHKVAENVSASTPACLLACWQTLIWRLAGCGDLIIGTAFDGQKYEELQGAIGLFARYLPIQSNLEEDLPFSQLLRQTDEQLREANKWQEYFSWEQRLANDDSAQHYLPFCFESRPPCSTISAGGLTFSIQAWDACIDRFKIKLVCDQTAGSLIARLQYDATAFPAHEISRLADELRTLVVDASHRPEAFIGELRVLSQAERHRLLSQSNETRRVYQTGVCAHEMFESQAQRMPDAIALVFEEDVLSYAEVNARANQIARRLRNLGVGPDVPVGLCVERSANMIVGLLAILKAGGAYLPLDPELPRERLLKMLEDAGSSVLIGEKSSTNVGTSEHKLVLVDADDLADESADDLKNETTEDNLAYVIFTSGSTGRPKGVGVSHRSLLNYVNAVWEKLELSAPCNFALVSTLSADLGHTVLFPSLLKGGTLHLISEERAADANALAEYFRRNPIDCLKIVPSHLAALLSGSSPEDIIPRLRLVLGGEACSASLVEKIKGLAPECVVFNHYGPTEATVGAIASRLDNHSGGSGSTVQLGRPLANTRVYVLDKRLDPVPTGAVGELHIGGDGLARGYVGRTESTAEKFIPDPFAEMTGARMYRTGDLARYSSDGNIEFVGRIDNQVKIRGYRIELGEIETSLIAHPRIKQAVAVAREIEPGDRRLVAYLVAEDHEPLDAGELRDLLKQRLPDYMVPSAFVFLDRFPLTPNGKIDRRALPAPDYSRSNQASLFEPPRNKTEEALAKIWTGVLAVEQIGIHDNFFELGGDSILSIQIIARANQAGLRLTPRQLFEHQTIAELAAVAGTVMSVEAEQDAVTGSVHLTPIQCRFFEQELADQHHYNQAMLLEIQPCPDPALLEESFRQILAHHDALRLRFTKNEGVWQQTNAAPDGRVSLDVIEVSGTTLLHHAEILQGSLNLEEGPLVRAALFNDRDNERSHLLVVIHHLAVDTVSWRFILEDLQTSYEQLSKGAEASLPRKTTPFKSWAERLIEHANSDALRQEAPYWLALSEKRVGRLPRDNEGGANTVATAQLVSESLSEEETTALLREVPPAYRTQINEILLTALARAFSAWTGSALLLADLEGHGREDILEGVDLSRTVGWFTTIFPVALDTQETDNSTDALRLVKEQLRAIPNRGIGYGLLRYLSSDPETAAALHSLPQPEIRFNYLGQLDRGLAETSLFKLATESKGPSQSRNGRLAYLLDIIGSVSDGELRTNWTYSENVYRRETIERLAKCYVEELRDLIARSRTGATASYSVTDFPQAKLSPEALKKVLSRLSSSHQTQK